MAASKKRKKKSNLHLDKDKRTLITTSRDVVVECLPVAALFMAMEENVKSSIEWPQVPIRISKDVAGAEMEFPLTLAHLETENATEEHQNRPEQKEDDHRIGDDPARGMQ